MTEEREQQATGSPITVEETFDPTQRRSRYRHSHRAEYIEATDEVRFITDIDYPDEDSPRPKPDPTSDEPPGEPIYDTRSFEEWAADKCRSAIVKYINRTIKGRLGDAANRWNPLGGRMRIDPRQSSSGDIMAIPLTSYINQEGETVFTPQPTFDQIVDAAPATATITIQLEGRDYTTTYPVMVTNEIRQLPAHLGDFRAEDLGQGGKYESIDEANRALPFVFRGPTDLPEGYSLTQITVHEPSRTTSYHGSLVYQSERGRHVEIPNPRRERRSCDDLSIKAHPADDPEVPRHPYGVDEDVTVNNRSGTYARTDGEFIGSLPEDMSDPAKRQNGILEFVDEVGTYYYLEGPFEKGELIRIAASIL